METPEAVGLARQSSLDLVEVAPASDPPVCRIMDYNKWCYQQKRRLRQAHKKSQSHAAGVKGIRLRPTTDKHDLEVKLKHARDFLEKGQRVQFTVFFRGRQVLHKDRGYTLLDDVVKNLGDLGKVEQAPRLADRRLHMVLVPAK